MPNATWRLVRAILRFLPLALALARDRNRYLLFGPRRRMTPERRRKRARKLKKAFIDLGPTYIKLGQLLSTRPDVVPQEYVDELMELQDDVPPAAYPKIERVIEEELGPVDLVFQRFERNAISGASLGQVHVAYYRGERVAVKVRRPGVERLVAADLRALNLCLPWLQRLMRLMGEDAHARSLGGVAGDFERRINQEMDYVRESDMLNEIKSNFEGDDRVVIPRTHDEVCTERVLTMEYVDGVKINDLRRLDQMGLDRRRIASDLEKIYLKMTLVDGVYHGDPHPGNLAVDEEGRIVLYDFGMSGRLAPSLQRTFVDFYMAAASRDAEGVIDSMIEMGTLDRDADREIMVDVIEIAIQDLSGEGVDEFRMQRLMEEVDETVYEYPVTIPSYISLGLRVSTIVEGVCLELDPEFDFLSVAKEFFVEEGFVQREVRGRAREAFEEIQMTLEALARTPRALESGLQKFGRDDVEVVVDVEDSASHLRNMGKGISYALVGGASIVGSTVLSTSTSDYALPLFGFGVAMLYMSRRSFRDRSTTVGPRAYATRHQMDSGSRGDGDGRRQTEAIDGLDRHRRPPDGSSHGPSERLGRGRRRDEREGRDGPRRPRYRGPRRPDDADDAR